MKLEYLKDFQNSSFNLKKIEFILFLLLLISFGYFYNGSGWNQESRMAQIYQIIEKHELNINPYAQLTQDISIYNKNIYPNKPIGSTILGIIPYFIIYNAECFMGLDFNSPYIVLLNAYLVNFFANQLLSAFSCVLFFRLLLKITLNYTVSLTLVIAFSLSTLFFPYTSVYMGHTQTVSLLIIGLYCFYDILFNNILISKLKCFLGSFFISLAVITDFFAIYISFFIGIVVIFNVIKKKSFKHFIFLTYGLSIPLLILLCYQYFSFGHFLNIPMKFNNKIFSYNKESLVFGAFSQPKIVILKELLFGEYYGIFIFNPTLILGTVGLLYMFLNKDIKNKSLYFLLFFLPFIISVFSNLCFIGWWGGSSAGPRYLINNIPFILLGCQFVSKFKSFNYILLLLIFIGFYFNLSINATNPMPGKLKSLKYEIIQDFLNQKISNNETFPKVFIKDLTNDLKNKAAFNLGELLGLKKIFSIFPLFVLQIFFLLLLFKPCFKINNNNNYK